MTFYRWSLSFPPSPSRDVLLVFLNRTCSPSGKRTAFGPLQWHCRFEVRETAPGAALIAVGFPFFFLWSFLSKELWKQGGVRGTQSWSFRLIASKMRFQSHFCPPSPQPARRPPAYPPCAGPVQLSRCPQHLSGVATARFCQRLAAETPLFISTSASRARNSPAVSMDHKEQNRDGCG